MIIFGVICAGAAAARRGCYRWTVTSLPLQLRPVPGSACVSPSSAPAAGGATGEDARQEHGRGDESRHARWRGEVHDGPPLPPRSPRGVRPPSERGGGMDPSWMGKKICGKSGFQIMKCRWGLKKKKVKNNLKSTFNCLCFLSHTDMVTAPTGFFGAIRVHKNEQINKALQNCRNHCVCVF